MSVLDITPSTELEAVNEMMAAVGESSLSSLSGDLPPDASMAVTIFSNTNKALQSKGWHFNTSYDVTLSLESDNTISLGNNVVSVAVPGKDVAIRNQKLYDREDNEFTFDQEITNAVTITLLPFENTPETFRAYVTMSATFRFYLYLLGSSSVSDEIKDLMLDAKATFYDDETIRGKLNLGTGTADMYNMTKRGRNPRVWG